MKALLFTLIRAFEFELAVPGGYFGNLSAYILALKFTSISGPNH